MNKRPQRPGGGKKRPYSDDKPKFSREDKPKFERGGKPRFKKEVSHPHKPTKKKPALKPEPTHIRLNKHIANSGVCSRREADELIKDGKITVNGKVVTEMGFQVSKKDKVKFEGRLLKAEKFQYVLLNKPKGFITTMKDERDRRTVMSLVEKACDERIYPVGRLDRQTTGLLLFTNDGELAKKLTHPSYKIKKIYQVELNKAITEADFNAILDGLELEDGLVTVDELAVLTDDKKNLGIQIHSGRNRIIRRIFEYLGYSVEKLDRVMFGNLTKKNLPRGKWRMLTDKEVALMG